MTKPITISTEVEKRLPNPLMIKTLAHIRNNPELFDMSTWGESAGEGQQCGTTACFAGHAVVLNGDVPLWQFVGGGVKRVFDYVKPVNIEHGYAYIEDKPLPVVERATALLGFTDDEADDIFYESYNNFEDILEDLTEHYGFDFSGVDWDAAYTA